MLEVKLEVGVILGPDPEHLTVGQLASSLYFPFAALWVGAAGKQRLRLRLSRLGAFTVEGSHLCPLNWTVKRRVHST